MYQNCSLILRFHLLIPQPTYKINAKNRQSKWVYSLVGNEPWMWNRRPDGMVINKYHRALYILEFERSSDRNKNFLRVKEDEANERHRSIIEALREIIAFPLVLFHRNLFFNVCCLSRQQFSAAYLLILFLLPQRVHTTLFIRCDKHCTQLKKNLSTKIDIHESKEKIQAHRASGKATRLLHLKKLSKKTIFTNLKKRFEHIELPAKLLDYFLRSNKSNINQSQTLSPAQRAHTARDKPQLTRWCLCSWHAGIQMSPDEVVGSRDGCRHSIAESTVDVPIRLFWQIFSASFVMKGMFSFLRGTIWTVPGICGNWISSRFWFASILSPNLAKK